VRGTHARYSVGRPASGWSPPQRPGRAQRDRPQGPGADPPVLAVSGLPARSTSATTRASR